MLNDRITSCTSTMSVHARYAGLIRKSMASATQVGRRKKDMWNFQATSIRFVEPLLIGVLHWSLLVAEMKSSVALSDPKICHPALRCLLFPVRLLCIPSVQSVHLLLSQSISLGPGYGPHKLLSGDPSNAGRFSVCTSHSVATFPNYEALTPLLIPPRVFRSSAPLSLPPISRKSTRRHICICGQWPATAVYPY